jgi:hypothetical protein
MGEERSKRPVREWIGPWIENWPSGHPETIRRRLRASLLEEQTDDAELSGRLEQALERVEEVLSALAELGAEAPSIADLEEMVERAAQQIRADPEPDPAPLDTHLLFLPSRGGYRLEERAGPPPPTGSSLELGDGRRLLVVVRHGPSPLPGDARRCAYLA